MTNTTRYAGPVRRAQQNEAGALRDERLRATLAMLDEIRAQVAAEIGKPGANWGDAGDAGRIQREGRLEWRWLWVVVGDGERRFVDGPGAAPAGARIVSRGERL